MKFRAWHKKERRMIYADEAKHSTSLLAIGLHGLPIAIDRDSFQGDEIIGWNVDHNIDLLQYTGLKDRNGRNIYEGDILGAPGEPRTFFQIVWDEQGLAWAGENSWAGRWLLVENRPGHNDIVLGNIYENPELLPKDKE